MNKELFPDSLIDNSLESIYYKHNQRSKTIYWLIILIILLFLLALFLIKVEITVISPGIITSNKKNIQLYTPISGKIERIYVSENEPVRKNDTLIVINKDFTIKKYELNNSRLKITKERIKDLKQLVHYEKKHIKTTDLSTNKYIKELILFHSKLDVYKTQIELLNSKFQRKQKLYNKNLIPPAEFEEYKNKLKIAQLNYKEEINSKIVLWNTELNNLNEELLDLETQKTNLQEFISKHFILAPAEGYVYNFSNIEDGSFVHNKTPLFKISPSRNLQVETFINSADIGFIKIGQISKIKVNAFNYSQWGTIQGNVTEISKDILINDSGKPQFKVICSIDDPYLKYNGHTVKIKKGMTISSNFIIAKRTLFQLIFDKTSNWLNPNDNKPK